MKDKDKDLLFSISMALIFVFAFGFCVTEMSSCQQHIADAQHPKIIGTGAFYCTRTRPVQKGAEVTDAFYCVPGTVK